MIWMLVFGGIVLLCLVFWGVMKWLDYLDDRNVGRDAEISQTLHSAFEDYRAHWDKLDAERKILQMDVRRRQSAARMKKLRRKTRCRCV